jgi:hypothetical protein
MSSTNSKSRGRGKGLSLSSPLSPGKTALPDRSSFTGKSSLQSTYLSPSKTSQTKPRSNASSRSKVMLTNNQKQTKEESMNGKSRGRGRNSKKINDKDLDNMVNDDNDDDVFKEYDNNVMNKGVPKNENDVNEDDVNEDDANEDDANEDDVNEDEVYDGGLNGYGVASYPRLGNFEEDNVNEQFFESNLELKSEKLALKKKEIQLLQNKKEFYKIQLRKFNDEIKILNKNFEIIENKKNIIENELKKETEVYNKTLEIYDEELELYSKKRLFQNEKRSLVGSSISKRGNNGTAKNESYETSPPWGDKNIVVVSRNKNQNFTNVSKKPLNISNSTKVSSNSTKVSSNSTKVSSNSSPILDSGNVVMETKTLKIDEDPNINEKVITEMHVIKRCPILLTSPKENCRFFKLVFLPDQKDKPVYVNVSLEETLENLTDHASCVFDTMLNPVINNDNKYYEKNRNQKLKDIYLSKGWKEIPEKLLMVFERKE